MYEFHLNQPIYNISPTVPLHQYQYQPANAVNNAAAVATAYFISCLIINININNNNNIKNKQAVVHVLSRPSLTTHYVRQESRESFDDKDILVTVVDPKEEEEEDA